MTDESEAAPEAVQFPCAYCGGPGWLQSGAWCERCQIGRDLAQMARRGPAHLPYRVPQPASDAAGVRATVILRRMFWADDAKMG
jgi:hypothetical protein